MKLSPRASKLSSTAASPGHQNGEALLLRIVWDLKACSSNLPASCPNTKAKLLELLSKAAQQQLRDPARPTLYSISLLWIWKLGQPSPAHRASKRSNPATARRYCHIWSVYNQTMPLMIDFGIRAMGNYDHIQFDMRDDH